MEFKDWISIIGIGVSLGWNAFNTLRGELRANRNIAYSEFGTLKNAADAALSELRAHKASLRGLQAYTGDEFTAKLQEVNKELSEGFNKLVSALEILDGSTHSGKNDWAEGSSLLWDEFAGTLDRIYAPKTPTERDQLIENAVGRLENCLSTAQRGLESEGRQILSPPLRIFRWRNLLILPAPLILAFLYWLFSGGDPKPTP